MMESVNSALSWLMGGGSAPAPAPAPARDSTFPFLEIPDGPLALIASFLPFRDALAYSHTCKVLHGLNIWVEVGCALGLSIPVIERAHAPATLAFVVRADLARRQCASEHFSISWGDDERYWLRMPVEGALGLIARVLRLVWWFDVREETGRMTATGSGTHFVFLKVRAMNGEATIGKLARRVWTVEGNDETIVGTGEWPVLDNPLQKGLPISGAVRSQPPEWVWLPVGSIKLMKTRGADSVPSAKVAFSVCDHHGSLKVNTAFSHAVVVHADCLTTAQIASLKAKAGP
jgi:hypothetical protein